MSFGALNNLFSKRSLQMLLRGESCAAFAEALAVAEIYPVSMTNGQALSAVYRYMSKHYRNEYFYKNTLLKKLVFGLHSPKTTTAICEQPIADSVADFIMVNGKAVVYEIKTDLDNFARLDHQIADYYKAFRFVNIVCSESAASKLVEAYADSPVGICVLTKRSCISQRKRPEEQLCSLDSSIQFSVLRKKERDCILLQTNHSLPDVSPVRYYRSCLELFNQIPERKRTILFEQTLKQRGSRVNLAALAEYPDELKLIAYNNNASLEEVHQLNAFLADACIV